MSIDGLLLLAFGVSMDAFAVSVCKGLAMGQASWGAGLTCGAWFGCFQAIMPLTGFYLGSIFAEAIERVDHWVAFGLLVLIGANMLKEAAGGGEEENADLSVKTMLLLAVATSIDALAVGISLAMLENLHIFTAVALMGGCTCAMSLLGVRLGNVFGSRFEQKAQIAGGGILIFLGLRILLEHLGVLG